MRLAEIQELMWRAMRWPTGVEDFLAQADDATRDAFERTFAQTEAFGRNERVQVYAEAYFWRLFEVLADQFEVTAWLMGPRHFHNLITDLVLAHPSQNPDIRRYGAPLPAFLATHAEAARVVGIEDIATIEWTILMAIDAKNQSALEATALADIPVERWPSLRFEATGTTALVSSRLPFGELWKACSGGDPAPAMPPAPLRAPESVLIWREGHEVFHRTVPVAEARALATLLEGRTFAQICDAAAGLTASEAGAQDVVRWLQNWLAAGLIHTSRLE